jgi:regulator of sirC expression with transglutaminase-like and TPR domain
METKELKSLITLLDDPDKEIFDHVAGRILSLGTGVIPTLEIAWEDSVDPVLQERIESLINRIQFHSLEKDITSWASDSEATLFEGAVLVARHQYHDLDKDTTKNYLDIVRRAIWLELNHNLTPFEQINVFNHIFYGMKGYTGKQGNEPNSYYINKVIESKTGNAVSLGMLYQILAQELDIPVYGVNLPRHYVLAYCKTMLSEEELLQDQQKNVLFYINPLSKGAIFTRNEVKAYLEKINTEESPECFSPCSSKDTIRLLIEHLIHAYQEQKNQHKVDELKQMLAFIQ